MPWSSWYLTGIPTGLDRQAQQVKPNGLSSMALLQCTLKFNYCYYIHKSSCFTIAKSSVMTVLAKIPCGLQPLLINSSLAHIFL